MKKKDQESLRKIVIIGLVLVVGYLGYQSMTSGSSPIGEASEPDGSSSINTIDLHGVDAHKKAILKAIERDIIKPGDHYPMIIDDISIYNDYDTCERELGMAICSSWFSVFECTVTCECKRGNSTFSETWLDNVDVDDQDIAETEAQDIAETEAEDRGEPLCAEICRDLSNINPGLSLDSPPFIPKTSASCVKS